ncbi:MAG: hypothetical protein JWL70_1601 [Acidimicrobiia bacterium]|nr:hypothetical protein [Acidimicrobiia bacterium]
MLFEVDEALRTLVRRDALDGQDIAEVSFEAPTKDWASRRTSPTIDVYLYDIREDLRRREVGRLRTSDGDGRVTGRVVPPRWFKLSYLVTAWTQRPEDEHRLLTSLLSCFLRIDLLPRDVLIGSLADLALPIPVTIAIPPPEDRALSDTWSALGGELKPSLDVVVIAPFDLQRAFPAGPLVLEAPTLVLGSAADMATAAARSGLGEAGDGASDLVSGGRAPQPGRVFRLMERPPSAGGEEPVRGQANPPRGLVEVVDPPDAQSEQPAPKPGKK